MPTPPDRVARIIVRMYRQLLGDCFLLRIQGSDARWTHVLIDCGLLQNLKGDGVADMAAIAEDIRRTTGGRLDVLVVTHEHWDHISGFGLAGPDGQKPLFLDPDRLKIDQLWMAWTEDPQDEQAGQLRERFAARRQALALAAQAFAAAEDEEMNGVLDGLPDFMGPVEGAPGLGLAPAGRMTGRRIMLALQERAGKVRYCTPGEVFALSGDMPFEVAVLAPPRTSARLMKDAPSAGDAKETYLAETSLRNSFLSMSAEGEAAVDRDSPFAWRFSDGLSEAAVAKGDAPPGSDAHWLWQRYFAAADPYEERPQDFRRIDGTWAEAARSLALKLDSDTNNTSLVLAFRLPDADGSFLLFAADAQVGNWLSWHDQNYRFGDTVMSAEDILKRTRLYKVGHHGSHNATLAEKGLKLMTHRELVAMLPTIEAAAARQGRKGWQMPDPDVKAALLAHTGGRLLRGDRRFAEDPDTEAARSDADFARRLDDTHALYLEYCAYEHDGAPPILWQNGDNR